VFDAPAGPLRIRMVSENAQGRRLDSEDVSFLVPDFTATGPVLSTPQVFRGRTARDIAQIRAGAAGAPVAARQFSRTERLLLRFDAYGPAGTTPRPTLRLLNRQGEPIADLPAPAASGPSTFDVEIVLAAFPPGDYLVEIAATATEATSTVLLGLRITG
jgi:hypothetical protein